MLDYHFKSKGKIIKRNEEIIGQPFLPFSKKIKDTDDCKFLPDVLSHL